MNKLDEPTFKEFIDMMKMGDGIEHVEKLLEMPPHIEIIPSSNLDDGTIIPANNQGEFYPIPSMVTRLYVSMDVFDVLKKLEKDER